jgi:hypothetical protein
LGNDYFEDRKGDAAMIRMCFRKTDGGDVFSNSVYLVDIYNTGLLLKVLHKIKEEVYCRTVTKWNDIF